MTASPEANGSTLISAQVSSKCATPAENLFRNTFASSRFENCKAPLFAIKNSRSSAKYRFQAVGPSAATSRAIEAAIWRTSCSISFADAASSADGARQRHEASSNDTTEMQIALIVDAGSYIGCMLRLTREISREVRRSKSAVALGSASSSSFCAQQSRFLRPLHQAAIVALHEGLDALQFLLAQTG